LLFVKNTLIVQARQFVKEKANQEKANPALKPWLERPVRLDGKIAGSSPVTPSTIITSV
jgi:hypothetical protein